MKGRIEINNLMGDLNQGEIKHAPDLLFYEGNLDLLSGGRRVSVVGSRDATLEGIKRAMMVAKMLIKHDITIVSGLAEGIDTIGHTTAIENGGRTIAVLGTPLDQVFPKSNEKLLEKIKLNHLAISQFPENYPTTRKNFPIRNRTMALISDATIIIEASENSGTRHQGWEALRLGRTVFILENIIKDSSISWAKEMLKYGAQILNKDNADDYIIEIPNLTARKEVAF